MTTTEQTPAAQHPLIGRIVHGAVQAGIIGGPALLGWSLVDAGVAKAALAALLGALAASLWIGTWSPDDPDPSWWRFVAVPGRIRLLIEIALIVAGGISIWLGWNRAAGETFLTLALLDYAVRYQRLTALYRGATAPISNRSKLKR